jgi:hypothetical protein
MRNLISPPGTRGNLTPDAQLAALAIEHVAELCSTHNGFGQIQPAPLTQFAGAMKRLDGHSPV